MPPTRVLVVDDSVVIRKLLSDLLGEVPSFEVVGTASNGKVALSRIDQLKPDVVVLDVEMPVMDGLQALREIKRRDPAPYVVMFSTFTTSGAKTTVEALTLGAEDYVAKPSNRMTPEQARASISSQLVKKIQAVVRGHGRRLPDAAVQKPTPAVAPQGPPKKVDLVVIGASTGGPNALALLFSRFPANFPVPIVVVQHMPAEFTPHLAERLARESNLPVREAQEGATLLPGEAWIAPGGRHTVIERGLPAATLHLTDDPPVNSCRPSVDVLFQSVAPVYGKRALGVVMTGMGEDGLVGGRQLKAAGSSLLAQDEASSVVWGMAGAVANARLAEAVLPPMDLGDEIVRRVRVGRI